MLQFYEVCWFSGFFGVVICLLLDIRKRLISLAKENEQNKANHREKADVLEVTQ